MLACPFVQLALLGCDLPSCNSCADHGNKGNCRTNPNCLAALVPLPGSFRKTGLWQVCTGSVTQLCCPVSSSQNAHPREPLDVSEQRLCILQRSVCETWC